ncbi:MAG: hypothetical protein ABOK23_06695 [Candidatus Methanoperedens sp.]
MDFIFYGYSSVEEKKDITGLLKFCEEFKTRGLVITKDLLRNRGTLYQHGYL